MNILTPCNMTLLMSSILFLLGLGISLTGVTLLVTRTWGKDVRSLAVQATRLAQKGLAEDVAGLVGNANILLNTLNELVRTTAGIGIFLSLMGLAMMASTFFLIFQTRTLCLN